MSFNITGDTRTCIFKRHALTLPGITALTPSCQCPARIQARRTEKDIMEAHDVSGVGGAAKVSRSLAESGD